MPEPVEQRMAEYYAQRAHSYERIYHKPERQADLRAIETWLGPLFSGRTVLELACGTGWWTAHGARAAKRWLATDLNPETMALARAKPMPAQVEFRELDAYALAPLHGEAFDAAFAGFWVSHVPLQRLRGWLATLHDRLAPGAQVVLLDNAFVAGSSTPISRRDEAGNTYQQRPLPDGSMHEVLKNFPAPADAIAALGAGVQYARWHAWPHYWALSYTLS